MQRNLLKKRIRARLATTAIVMKAFSNQTFTEAGFDITPEQYTVLSLIIENKGLYQRQLSEITLKDRANISRFIKILEDKDLIKRTSDSNGRQIFIAKVTQKGIDLYNKMQPAANNIRKIAANGIKDEELEICLNTLDKIFSNFEDKVNLQI